MRNLSLGWGLADVLSYAVQVWCRMSSSPGIESGLLVELRIMRVVHVKCTGVGAMVVMRREEAKCGMVPMVFATYVMLVV